MSEICNPCPWGTAEQVEVIRMIGYLGELWSPGMSVQRILELYKELTAIPQVPGKMEEP